MNKIESYIASVIPKNIPKYKQKILRDEIEAHIYDRIDFYTEIGYDNEASINKALADMGEDEEIKTSIRNDFEQVFKMNKFVKGILCIFVSVFLLFVGGCAALVIEVTNGPLEQNDVCLFDDYYMYRNRDTNSKFYVKNDESSLNHTLIQGWIYKYSYDENSRMIALRYLWAYEMNQVSDAPENVIYYRWYSGVKYSICEDMFKLYDCKEDKFFDFETEAELKKYCNENKITLSEWYYPGGNGYWPESKAETLLGEYSLKKASFGYSSVLKGDEELLFGLISDVKVDGDVISLRLRQTKNMYSPEYITTNSALSPLSVNPVGKYKGYDIYYDKYIYIYPDRIVEKP